MPFRPINPDSPFALERAARFKPTERKIPVEQPQPDEPDNHKPVTPRKRATSAEDAEYEVGKWKPPVHSRFQKGVSGNPKGKSPGTKNLRTLTLEILGEKKTVRTSTGTKQMNAVEFGLSKLYQMVAGGKERHLKQVFDLWRDAVPDQALESASPAPVDAELSPVEQQIWDTLLGQLQAPNVRGSVNGGAK